MTSLHKVLKDIASVGSPETPFGKAEPKRIEFPQCMPGPNTWDNVQPEDFGKDFDYITTGHGTIVVIDPVSPAAVQWLYRHLPEDCPRWGALGFVVESRYVLDVMAGMKRDGLTSQLEYDEAMANEERDRHAGEGQ